MFTGGLVNIVLGIIVGRLVVGGPSGATEKGKILLGLTGVVAGVYPVTEEKG